MKHMMAVAFLALGIGFAKVSYDLLPQESYGMWQIILFPFAFKVAVIEG